MTSFHDHHASAFCRVSFFSHVFVDSFLSFNSMKKTRHVGSMLKDIANAVRSVGLGMK